MDDCKSSDMHCPDLLDIYNEEFNFEHFPKEKNRKTKEVTLKEKYENKESFPLKSEYSSKTLSSGCCTENNLPVFTKVKSMGKGKSGDTNPSIELFISSYSKEIGENTELEKYCNNTSKENELHDFLRTVNQRPMNSNCKNVAKEDGDDKFWDFLKTNIYSAADDECALGLLSDAEQAELKSLSLITSSFDYGSQTLSSVEKTCSSEFSSAISTSMTYANVLSNTNVTVDGLRKQNSNGSCPKVKITDIEVTEKNSNVTSKGTLNEFEDFSKPKCQKHTDKKIFSPKENKLRHSLNQDNLMKSNYSFENIDTEDTFWDFLNPNLSADEDIKCDFGSLTDEEIQELQSLLPIKTSPVNAASYTKKDSSPILNTVSPVAKVSSPLISPDEDIFKDLDLLLAEINTTVGDMQKQTEQGQKSLDSSEQMFNSKIQNEKYKSSQKSNSAAPSAKLTDKNKSYDPKIINQNIPVAVFPPLPSSIPLRILHPKALNKNQLQGLQQNTEQFYDNAKHNFKQGLKQGLKQATSTPCTFVNHSCLGVEKTLLKSNNVKVTESNSNIAPYPFCKFKPIACKTDSQFSLINFENTGSKYETENSAAVQLPVISSVFSIPANIYERSDFLHNQQILNESNELNASTNCIVEGPSQNLNVSHENVNISTDVSETNADDSAAKRSSIYISPRKRKNTKHLLPRSSPKNSLFRVTDSSSSNIQHDYENIALNNALDMKRRKTNESVKSDYSTDSGISVSGTPMCLPQIPQKLFALTSTNNAITPNSTPVYWIVSQNPQPNQNKNSDVLMVLNNGNQVINNPCIKMPITLTNSNVPISTETTIPGVTSTQIPKANDKTTTTVFQQIPLHTVTVMNVEPSNGFAETSNSMKSDTLNNSKIQSVSHNALKTQVQIKSEANKIKFISTTMPQNLIQINNANIYTIPSSVSNISGSGGLQSTTSNASNNLYIQNANPHVNQPSLPVISNYYSLNTVHSNPSNQLMPGGLFPIQHVNQIPQPKIRPIKNIPLGKNKNAIQQIRIPVKIADIKDSVAANIYDTSKVSANILNSQRLKVSSTIPSMINQVKLTRNIVTSEAQAQNRVYDFIPYKPKSDSTNIVKRNIITSETEFINKDKFFRVQTLNSKNLSDKSSKVGESSNLISFYQGKETVWSNSSDTSVSSTHNVDSIQNTLSFDKVATKSSEFVSKPQSDGSQKNTLATIQQLFPPPVSTIPVCVMQTVQTTNKPAVTKVVVLQNTNTNNSVTQTSNQKNRRKVTTEKEKKVGRKTVRELLQERYNQSSSNKPFQSQLTTKILKPIYRLGSNGLLLPPDLPNLANKFSGASNSHYITAIKNNPTTNPNKRPNIMILPSAAKTAQNTIISKEDCKKNYQEEPQTADNSQTVETNGNEIFKMPSDFLFEKMDTSKEYRPKYYDMCELRIGYFKVEDDVDSYGRFRSKFKVLFKKSLFVYDFPITKCNQIDLSNDYSNEEIVCIQVPFKTVLSMNMNNRHILIQVNKIPQVFLKNTEEGSDFISGSKEKHKITEGIMDSLQNSSVHKITLRKRQADNLKVNLCQFDDRFLLLCSVGSNNTNSVLDASPFDEEIATLHLKKIFQKNRRNVIRRLPQWDPDRTLEPLEVLNSDHLVSSNHVCSCRISCRSLRCSCVKAAKICGTSGSVCQCTNCDNPLNLLQSFGINLEYSLNDCCLFQNIYQIPKLRNFLQRNVKLSCCNTVARVLDCIPGTVLCPNTECNEQLEFSWCGAVICYPERNPRNHCSFCGQCCFSNGCHCTICNRCYIVTSEYKDCPHCTGLIMNPVSGNYEFIDEEFASENIFESSTAKIFPKPEIIVLDGPSSANCNMEATLSISKEGGDNERKESQEHLYLNKENVDNKSDEKCIFPVYMETDINTSAISEQKVEICNEFDSYETGNKNYMNKIAEAITHEVKSKECHGIFEDDLKIEIPLETSVKVMTKIDITSS